MIEPVRKFSHYLDEELLKESINDKYLFKAVFMCGGSGSGKSFIADMSFKGLGVFVNSDILFEIYLKKEKLPFEIDSKNKVMYSKQREQRKKAKKVVTNRVHHWINGMLPLIIDGTGKEYNKIKAQKEALQSVGYDTYMVFVNTNLDVALQRNRERERSVPEEVARKAWKDVQNNIGKFQTLFGGSNFFIVDNNEILKGKELKDMQIRLTRVALGILNSKLENPLGKGTIDTLVKTKGKYIVDITPDKLDQIGIKV